MSIQSSIVRTFAPTGRLRASINFGNPILAAKDRATGEPVGVSIDLAREFARSLDVEVDLVLNDTAGNSVETVKAERADIGFFAIDPARGSEISFTPPYVLIEGCYLVRQDSPLQHGDEVDRPGNRVAVGAGSAYDLYLSRSLGLAQIVRAPSSPAVVDTFLAQNLEVAAGVRQQLMADAERLGGLRLLPDSFMVIRQAMGVPKSRGSQAADHLSQFVEKMKAAGFVEESLQRHGIEGAAVAPLHPVPTQGVPQS